jgi:hypothetical protein
MPISGLDLVGSSIDEATRGPAPSASNSIRSNDQIRKNVGQASARGIEIPRAYRDALCAGAGKFPHQRQENYVSGLDRPKWSDLSYGRFGPACAGLIEMKMPAWCGNTGRAIERGLGRPLSTALALDVSDVRHFTDVTTSAQLEDGVQSCVGCWSSSR